VALTGGVLSRGIEATLPYFTLFSASNCVPPLLYSSVATYSRLRPNSVEIWWIPIILAYNTRGNPNWRFQTSRFTSSVVLLSTPPRLARQSYELNASTLICIPNSVRAMFLKFSSNSSSNFRVFRIGDDEVPHMKKATTRC